jgi:PAS domain S-box-containing protein
VHAPPTAPVSAPLTPAAASAGGSLLNDPSRGEALLRALTGVTWIYAAVALVWLSGVFTHGTPPEPGAEWIALPLQFSTLAALGLRARQRPLPLWVLLAALFVVCNLIANLAWNLTVDRGAESLPEVTDLLYLVNYAVLAAAGVVVFRDLGGSLRDRRVWLDALTVLSALLVVIWGLLVVRPTPLNTPRPLPLTVAAAYAVAICVLATGHVLLLVRTPLRRPFAWAHCLALTAVCQALWEVAWLSNWLTGVDLVGAYYDYGDVLSMALVTTALSLNMAEPVPMRYPERVNRQVTAFVPALAGLFAVTIVATAATTIRSASSWTLIGLLIVCGSLVTYRIYVALGELAAAQVELALRRADERLTELVRSASDLIMVVDPAGVVIFASPAAERILGRSPDSLLGQPFATIFGSAAQAPVTAFTEALTAAAGPEPATMEILISLAGDGTRVLKITGANQLGHPSLAGLTVFVTDVTEHRDLERHALDLLTQERVRLAANIHDGLGQELTGIAMMLQSAATATADVDHERQRAQLGRIIERLNGSIATARELAHGLSPLEVVRGSLAHALRTLADNAGGDVPVRVTVAASLEEYVLGDFPADHLCRIATEAVHNAVRHSRCTRIEIVLEVAGADLLLAVSDNGTGIERAEERRRDRGLGLRLVHYRARMIGGRCTIGTAPGGGTRVEVRVPLVAVSRATVRPGPDVSTFMPRRRVGDGKVSL